jgi:CRISPR-associated protein Cas5 subtype I-B
MFSFHLDVESEIAHFKDPTSHAFLNTFLAPTPHTIIGFLGACSGFSEKETEELTKKVKVGCIVLRLKGFLKDLVIMDNQKGKQIVKFPRTRKFLVGPKYRFFIASENRDLLVRLSQHISSPKHIPYLGISDCLAYIRKISKIKTARHVQLNDTESMVGVEVVEEDLDFYTKLKKAGDFTVYTETVKSSTAFQITEKGRKPTSHKKFLMSVNCRLFFKKPIEGYEIDGENVCLL